MELFPAIDLLGGQVVRLRQGAYDQRIDYDGDPVAVAQAFAAGGARWIHVVDLEAARSGVAANRGVVGDIVATVGADVAVQTGGGVRTIDDVRQLAGLGVRRLVLGSAAMQQPELVAEAAAVVPVAVGLDHRDGEVVVQGWTERTGVSLLDAVGRFAGASALVVTNVATDGMLGGPDLAGLRGVVAASAVPIVASGGVGSLDDVRALAGLDGLAGVIVGRALYEGRFRVDEAIEALAGAAS